MVGRLGTWFAQQHPTSRGRRLAGSARAGQRGRSAGAGECPQPPGFQRLELAFGAPRHLLAGLDSPGRRVSDRNTRSRRRRCAAWRKASPRRHHARRHRAAGVRRRRRGQSHSCQDKIRGRPLPAADGIYRADRPDGGACGGHDRIGPHAPARVPVGFRPGACTGFCARRDKSAVDGDSPIRAERRIGTVPWRDRTAARIGPARAL